MNVIDLYRYEYLKKQFERKDLFNQIQKIYNIEKGLYPGSYVHITPSFFIPYMAYIDSDKNAKKFFNDSETVAQFIKKNKTYPGKSSFRYIHSDYAKPLDLDKCEFDLLISQWAGPISQSCKKYLKPDGILIANNSHADAGIAFLDSSYKLVAVVQHRKGNFTFSEKNLDGFFIPKKDHEVTKESLLQSGSGIAYTKTANSYIFKKITG